MSTDPVDREYRAVRTGQVHGVSTIASDVGHRSLPLPTGRALAQLWRADRLLPAAESDSTSAPFPGANGARLWVLEIPPDEESHGHPFHATPTLDAGFVLAGQVDLELEDGSVTRLQQGDGFVQTGAAHRWVNRGALTAVLGVVVVGTGALDPSAVPPAEGAR